jgi:hypothetical protein
MRLLILKQPSECRQPSLCRGLFYCSQFVSKRGLLNDRGDLIQLAAPDIVSKAAKQESKMANVVKETASSRDIAEHPVKSRHSGTTGYDANTIVTEPECDVDQRLKPGNLAIVVKDGSDQLNLGVVVRILSDVGLSWWSEWDAAQNEWQPYRRLPTSYVEALSARGLSYHSDDCDGDLVVRRFGEIPTAYLRRFNE